jgi:S1-C subfamily serine protease
MAGHHLSRVPLAALAAVALLACTKGPLVESAAQKQACVVQHPQVVQLLALHAVRGGGSHVVSTPSRGASFPMSDRSAAARDVWDTLRDDAGYLVRFEPGMTIEDDRLVIAKDDWLADAPPRRTRGASDAGGEIYRENVGRVAVVERPGGGMGSAILVEPGLFVTNFHVVGGSPTVTVYMRPADGGRPAREGGVPGKVVAARVRADLALVEVDRAPSATAPARMGDLGSIDVGSEVFAIGHPKGLLWSFTNGTVSQIRKDHAWSYGFYSTHRATVIQTQTPINPGNSGGPLFNARGELVGINSFGNEEGTGLNFAVAVGEIRSLLEERPNPPSPDVKPIAQRDLDRDGRIETLEFDRDGDRQADLWIHDLDGNQKTDWIAVDVTYIGRPTVLLHDYNGDGKPDFVHVDDDEDGKIDLVVVDANYDGKPDGQIKCGGA